MFLEDKDYVILCDITYGRSVHGHPCAVKKNDNVVKCVHETM